MFCNKCGEILDDNARKCPACGASQKEQKTKINDACDCHPEKPFQFPEPRKETSYEYQPDTGNFVPKQSGDKFHDAVENVIAAVKQFIARRRDFRGRSSRAEFWWTYLFIALVCLVLYVMAEGLMVLWYLLILVPFLALGVRRLHDVGKSGWWLLIKLVPLVGLVLLILWFCQPSQPSNQWGAKP